MAGLNLNIGSSVLKREAKSISAVDDRLKSAGWRQTGTLAGGRVRYYSQSGINITAAEGPLGTVIMPSGPIRGAMFGSGIGINRESVIGAGQDTSGQTDKGARAQSNKDMI